MVHVVPISQKILQSVCVNSSRFHKIMYVLYTCHFFVHNNYNPEPPVFRYHPSTPFISPNFSYLGVLFIFMESSHYIILLLVSGPNIIHTNNMAAFYKLTIHEGYSSVIFIKSLINLPVNDLVDSKSTSRSSSGANGMKFGRNSDSQMIFC